MEAIDDIMQMVTFVRRQARYFRTVGAGREVIVEYLIARSIIGAIFSCLLVLFVMLIDVIFSVLLLEMVLAPLAIALMVLFIGLAVLSVLIYMSINW